MCECVVVECKQSFLRASPTKVGGLFAAVLESAYLITTYVITFEPFSVSENKTKNILFIVNLEFLNFSMVCVVQGNLQGFHTNLIRLVLNNI